MKPKSVSVSSAEPSVNARILASAEKLFADRGLDGVSVRDIAADAECQISSITYHFATKEGLFEAVIARRAEALCERRLAALDAALVASPCTIELILTAFIQPYVRLYVSEDPGWQNYARLIARMAQYKQWGAISEKYFNPTAHIFINSLASLHPDVPRSVVVRALVFVTHVMTMTFSGTQRAHVLSRGEIDRADIKGTYDALIIYCTGGVMSLLQSASGATSVTSKRRGAR